MGKTNEGIAMYLPMYRKGSTQSDSELEELAHRVFETQNIIYVPDPDRALRAALFGLGMGPGCDILVPAFGQWTPGPDVAGVGARPSYVDVGPELVLNAKNLEQKIESDYSLQDGNLVHRRKGNLLRGVVMTHPAGYSPFVDEVEEFAEKWNLALFDDARGALTSRCWSTSRCRWIYPGVVGQAGVVSLYDVAFFVARDHDLLSAVSQHTSPPSETSICRAKELLENLNAERLENARTRQNIVTALAGLNLGKVIPAPTWSEPGVPLALLVCQDRNSAADQLEDMGFSVETEIWPQSVLEKEGNQFSYRRNKCELSEELSRKAIIVGLGSVNLA